MNPCIADDGTQIPLTTLYNFAIMYVDGGKTMKISRTLDTSKIRHTHELRTYPKGGLVGGFLAQYCLYNDEYAKAFYTLTSGKSGDRLHLVKVVSLGDDETTYIDSRNYGNGQKRRTRRIR